MITKDLKPIPNYIVNKIRKLDDENRLLGNNGTTYYSYFTKFKGDLTQITVACKTKDKQWFCKQVVVRPLHSEVCYVKDIEYSLFGYTTGWYNQAIGCYNPRTTDTRWCDAPTKYYNLYVKIINKSYIQKQSKYKYSAINQYPYLDLFKYLRIYEEYPQTEYLVKMKLSQFATNKTILKQIGKDKNFRKWIVANKEILQNKYGRYSYISAQDIQYAYKNKISILEAQQINKAIKELNEEYIFKAHLKNIIKRNEVVKFYKYLNKNHTDCNSYWDYLKACQNLNLDITEETIKYPKDFVRMHDLRIDEYEKIKLLEDEKARKELYKNFKQIANKYLSLERLLIKDDYVCIIAKSPAELKHEGQILHHCVGRMNYDQKFVREESLIFFIRNRLSPNTPFVTLEYSLRNHKILQCYAEHNTKPNEAVLEFVNKKWLPYANRKLKKLVA